ncbi:MAG TPA: ammonia channel protein [Elusimicrobia bacterium]|nr:ammonia channel protein [Elusimicrobiota bacterium]
MKKLLSLTLFGLFMGLAGPAIAEEISAPAAAPAEMTAVAVEAPAPAPAKIDTGDTAWVMTSSAFVMLMTLPGLAFFYGGLVRKKNVLSILMQSGIMLCVITLQWVLFGYSLSFSPGNGFIGGLKWLGLNGVGLTPYPDYAATIPHQAFMIFQGMFAVITPALIIGAFAERMKFSAFLVFSILWATLVYDPVAHWVWGLGGWLRNMGALDFAGGTVVHINAGVAAIVAALMLGKRKGYANQPVPPHNLPFTVLGAGLLWFGWFGFNAGSALGANGLAVGAFVTTNTAAAAAGLTWALIEWLHNGTPTTLGVATGLVAGLVAITPAAGYVGVMPAILIGVVVSLICFVMVAFVKTKLGYDDSLDAFGVHGIGGIWGALATGLFASKAVNPAGADGLFYGNPAQFVIQLKAVLITALYSLVVTWLILKLVNALFGVRASEKDEVLGLDLSQHHEGAYTVLE